MVAVSCTMSTSSDAPQDFNPYQKWLGLAPQKRPYDHYGLLGLETFESDRQVISNAAQRSMAQLRKRRTGAAAREAKLLIAELSKATTCLLNPNRKRLYDQHLRSLAETTTDHERPVVHLASPVDRQSHSQLDPQAAWEPEPEATLPPQTTAADSPAADSLAADSPAAVADSAVTQRPPARPTIVTSTDRRVGRSPNRSLFVTGLTTIALIVVVAAVMAIRGRTPASPDADSPPVAAIAFDNSPELLNDVGSPTAPASAKESTSVETPGTPPIVPPAGPPAVIPSTRAFELPADQASSALPSSTAPAEVTQPPDVPLPFAPTDDNPKAIRFTGTDRITTAEPLTSLDFSRPFTLELWVRFAEGTNAHWLMGDLVLGDAHPDIPRGGAAGWQAWIERTTNGRQRFAIATREGLVVEYPDAPGAWRHFAVSGDGTTVSIFVDGRKAASRPATLLSNGYIASPLPLHFGSHNFLSPQQPAGLEGEMRAVRISTTCRYRENFKPLQSLAADATTALVFDFQHAVSSQQIDDLSRHARHGTLWGAQWVALSEAPAAPGPSAGATPGTAVAAGPGMPSTGLPGMRPVGSTTSKDDSEAAASATRAMPSETEQAAARKQIETLFAAELAAARQSDQQLELAAKLVALAGESSDDRAAQFVMYEMAVTRLAQGNDLSKSLKVLDDFASQFDLDRLARQADVIQAAGSGPRTVAQRQALAESALQAGDEMSRAGRFDLVEKVAQVAVTSATRARNSELGRRARLLRDQGRRAGRLAAEADIARQQLVAAPDDPNANLTYGKFLCLQRNQWLDGAPLLAKSEVEVLKRAAVAETKAANSADEADRSEAQAAAAELWYAAQTAVGKDNVPALLEHVLDLARTAAPGLKGIARATLEKRITQITSELPSQPAEPTTPKPAWPRFAPPPEFQSLVGRMKVNGQDASTLWKYRSGLRLLDSNVADILAQSRTPRGHLQLEFVGMLSLPETTRVTVTHQGGSPRDATATLYVDGKLIGTLGGEKATTETYQLDLAKGEHKVAWQLAGRDLATNVLRFDDADTSTPLVIYHDAALLNAVRESPSRARLTVNLMGGPGIK